MNSNHLELHVPVFLLIDLVYAYQQLLQRRSCIFPKVIYSSLSQVLWLSIFIHDHVEKKGPPRMKDPNNSSNREQRWHIWSYYSDVLTCKPVWFTSEFRSLSFARSLPICLCLSSSIKHIHTHINFVFFCQWCERSFDPLLLSNRFRNYCF